MKRNKSDEHHTSSNVYIRTNNTRNAYTKGSIMQPQQNVTATVTNS